MSRALQKYAQSRGIAMTEGTEAEQSDEARRETLVPAQLAQDKIQSDQLSREAEQSQLVSGATLGGGLAVGKLGSKLQEAAKVGKKVLSGADKAAARVSRIARATGNESIADGVDAARNRVKATISAAGDTADNMTSSVKGVTQASSDGLGDLAESAKNIKFDFIDAGSGESLSAPLQTASQTTNISEQATGASRSMLDRILGRNQAEPELEDETEKLARIRDEREAAGDFDAPQDQELLKRIRADPNLNPSLSAPDQAVANRGRTIGEVSEDFAERFGSTARTAAATTGSEVAPGFKVLADVTGKTPPTQPIRMGGSLEEYQAQTQRLGAQRSLATEPTADDVAPEDILGRPVNIPRQPTGEIKNPAFDPDDPGVPDNISSDAPRSTGQPASTGNVAQKPSASQQASVEASEQTATKDATIGDTIEKDTGDLVKEGAIDLGEGAGEEALSLGSKFMKYGGAFLEGLGVAADVASFGYDIYELTQIPKESSIEKEKAQLAQASTAAATPGKVAFGNIAGATLDSAPGAEAGTFSHF